jgi:hypothetical protein
MKTLDSGENDGQHEGDNVDCDPTIEAKCSSSETHLLTQGYLNKFHHDFNGSKWTHNKLCESNGSKQRWIYVREK